jgi:hypothetical protein
LRDIYIYIYIFIYIYIYIYTYTYTYKYTYIYIYIYRSFIPALAAMTTGHDIHMLTLIEAVGTEMFKLTWLVLGEDPAARSHRVEQFTAL